MAKTVIIDEPHVTLRVPANLPGARAAAVHRALTGAALVARLRRAVRSVVRADPVLAVVRVAVSR